MKKINIGCGPIGKDDWVNLDWGIVAFAHRLPFLEKVFRKIKLIPEGYRVQWPKNLLLHDCRRNLPFADNSVDFIYTSHFIEHLKKFDAQRLLEDCYRVLKHGGVLRISVPDLKILAGKYVENDVDFFVNFLKLEKSNPKDIILADIFNNMFYPESYGRRFKGLEKLMYFFARPHLWMYDYASLSSLLKECGFKTVEQKSFRQGEVPDLKELDVFPEISLYVEVKK